VGRETSTQSISQSTCLTPGFWVAWASAHRGKWGQLTPWKNGRKIKSENVQKELFSEWGWGVKAGVENAPFRSQFLKIFFASGGKGAFIYLF